MDYSLRKIDKDITIRNDVVLKKLINWFIERNIIIADSGGISIYNLSNYIYVHDINPYLTTFDERQLKIKYVCDNTQNYKINAWEYLDISKDGTLELCKHIAYRLEVMPFSVSLFPKTIFHDHNNINYIHDVLVDNMIPYEKNTFKIVTCFEVLSGVENVEEFIKSIYDIIIPNGIFIFSEFDCKTWEDAYLLKTKNNIIDHCLQRQDYDGFRTRKNWIELIISLGFGWDYNASLVSNDDFGTFYEIFIKY